MPRILIVDDHAPFRRVARALLERAGFAVVGEASDGLSALESVRRLDPDLVLLDIQLPGEDGFAVCERIALESTVPDRPLVVLTSGRPIGTFRRRLARSQAAAFIGKTDLTGAALTAVLEGRAGS
jgi:CheY-like chemotaxis protein